MVYTFGLPSDEGLFVGRLFHTNTCNPCVIAIREGEIFDITSRSTPTMYHLLEDEHPSTLVIKAIASCRPLTTVAELENQQRLDREKKTGYSVLAPCDLQAIKACGVTFANSMIERVIEEKAIGDPLLAAAIRKRCETIIGDSLRNLVAGSQKASEIKQALIQEGLWSQYLEVGIGPDAEVFTKGQPMSAIGWGSEIGIHPASNWNNPEPEIVLAVDSKGRAKGATLGNDVNLRDIEGRSALLLGKAKDNNASCAIGPFIRLFDDSYDIDDVRESVLELTVTGNDGYVLSDQSSMSEISRDPLDLIAQTCGVHHQYPDGFMLFLGTLFAPIQDRDTFGEGFTHKINDIVAISNPQLGTLVNRVQLSTECPPWTFGTAKLMKNLAIRELL